ncbi:hypothetical protein [Geoalkalibacter halelectricus]|uniref:hypothetical protein n=1 Tax=Geoalkalibacter halelectricus TaxID=2847045 RepID=UPI0026701E95|nr:hypothetical protein [Geoalkalibacter halelectricus]
MWNIHPKKAILEGKTGEGPMIPWKTIIVLAALVYVASENRMVADMLRPLLHGAQAVIDLALSKIR